MCWVSRRCGDCFCSRPAGDPPGACGRGGLGEQNGQFGSTFISLECIYCLCWGGHLVSLWSDTVERSWKRSHADKKHSTVVIETAALSWQCPARPCFSVFVCNCLCSRCLNQKGRLEILLYIILYCSQKISVFQTFLQAQKSLRFLIFV